MKCSICGKELTSVCQHVKLNLCEACNEHITNISSHPHDQNIKNTASAYFSSLTEKGYRRLDCHGVSIPLTEEYCHENPAYNDALSKAEDNLSDKSAAQYVTKREFINYMNRMQDSLENIERYTRFTYISAGIIAIMLAFCIFNAILNIIYRV